ncbi:MULTISPECIES: energy-coupling factor ABC transporter permease [unclassified Halomonas]|uniref:energy-coupling factor ABC transporter permease n=1 Tax=unclassified Halomonas TaxID=2609666 RepID=UPI001C966407|nr:MULTISPECIES: energy-coupling factor ABC transporter permease [unclassified Halomonas]MBY5927048.1 energy-coupling factor ABC transporter permease [Halomonas sp. DP4Y7-2]MBY6234090.1 energy-coupling factor ABC transporter permease [Halomonas sp. DP4Y7-1]
MSFAEVVVAGWMLWLGGALSAGCLLLVVRQRPWQALVASAGLQHRWLAATVMMALLWQLRAQTVDWLSLHLLFTTLLTLVFRAPLALLSCLLVNLSLCVTGRVAWPLIGLNLVVTGVVPMLVTIAIWRLVDRRLPAHPMVFLFVGGFGCAALSSLASGLAVMGVAWFAAVNAEVLFQVREYLRFLPLLMPSEAFISGMLLSILMFYHPHWVATFNDRRYLDDDRK